MCGFKSKERRKNGGKSIKFSLRRLFGMPNSPFSWDATRRWRCKMFVAVSVFFLFWRASINQVPRQRHQWNNDWNSTRNLSSSSATASVPSAKNGQQFKLFPWILIVLMIFILLLCVFGLKKWILCEIWYGFHMCSHGYRHALK